mmetsp:Transcript_5074/g.14573  ORF Transcript_5074/g.14573 Transcript_5074/m.14573 type:complete len:475 (-) Transcript_5074:460-1884(-)|eukprot:CAMPEP_0206140468 /NCGR_PEP_ID=MMETSP1473-20131121/9543_1 /ASSEMBLY_ACC=CAM_ASM_001109 /TAXON_ID=1461547 /ORGANISM="Stichococcus sp, Strain RCC1054" /LENGTH=474 /DNA_ID=CAMNT_0053534625 /DNA_START=97 /DNA_END=1521 /DNA_ORIENTATION=-
MSPSCCGNGSGVKVGPGYNSPQEAQKGPKEKILYLPAIVPDASRPDYLVTIDVDPESDTYQQIIHRTHLPNKGDEIHHTGWNACSSCNDGNVKRKHLIVPGFASGRIHAVDVFTDPKAPKITHVLEPETILKETGLSWPHTSHCLGDGTIVISTLGDAKGEAKGGFLVLDQELKIKSGTWTDKPTDYGYDFWYKPRFDLIISSEFGSPLAFKGGFDPSLVGDKYGNRLHVWSWKTKEHKQVIDLGPDGLIPLEIRFLHEPSRPEGFLGAALSSNVLSIHPNGDSGKWATSTVIKQPWTPVEGWALPEQPPLITDILVSLDDKYLYFSNWLRGDINQYDISDPLNPRHTGRVFVGGSIRKGSGVTVTDGEFKDNQPEIPAIRGRVPEGGPQMIQLSLDGKRLYVTNSLLSGWDKQFYPDMVKNGSQLLRINVDNVNGGLSIDEDFLVDFGKEPDGPVLAHEVRFPGGDSSSDIWN